MVRIDVIARQDASATTTRLQELGEAVHQALIEAIGVPADDRFQILRAHDKGLLRYDPEYLGVHRDDDIVFVTITMRAGRSAEQKAALYRRITELAADRTGTEARNVLIALVENESTDWSFGDGVGQYMS
jgi:phenylpyruvate tautomerase PptA (4-oxalocrotonate tautomerase family)